MKNYKIKGIELNEAEMYSVKQYYEEHSTAECIQEFYGYSDNKALELAKKVRFLMDDYGYKEDEAIHIVCK